MNERIIRMCLVIRCIQNMNQPSKMDIVHYCREQICGDPSSDEICMSSIEKDMYYLRSVMDAPIIFKRAGSGGYYAIKGEYDFWKVFLEHFSLYVDFPKFILLSITK